MTSYRATIKRDLMATDISQSSSRADVFGLRRFHRGTVPSGMAVVVAKHDSLTHPWVAILPDGSILGFSTRGAKRYLETIRRDGKPIQTTGPEASAATRSYADYQDSLRTVYHGD